LREGGKEEPESKISYGSLINSFRIRGGGYRINYFVEEKEDFLKIKSMIGKCPPSKLGEMFKDYYLKYRKIGETKLNKVGSYTEALEIFDGKVKDLDDPY
jgi:hypothetical protein